MWIHDAIERRGGAIPFDELMELALYDPAHGYYSGEEVRYGRRGDFLTAPTASGWYAATLGRLIGSLAAGVGSVEVADVASGDGAFLRALIDAAPPGGDAGIRRIVSAERSPARRARQEMVFRSDHRVRIVADLEEADQPPGPAVLHASELYDALPVRRAVRRETGLMEMWVTAVGEGLGWQERPARDATREYLASRGIVLEVGQIAEINLGAEQLHRRLLAWAGENALAIVLDYGYPADRLYNPRGRRNGSLACYRRHRLSRDPLEAPGEQDITAHINWDDLRRAAASLGWKEVGLWPLAEFLIRAGLGDLAAERGLGMETDLNAAVYAERQEIKRLLNPEGMGADLKVLVQGCGPLADAAA
ncbi:MAG: hypothetical protein GXP48_12465, partial [Acidobacteria bacterium]|nr:hypothetical protein [Acidobacteriota bacterium]